MEILEVLPIGTAVIIGKDIEAKIVGIYIKSPEYVEYNCGWWAERQYHTMYLPTSDFRLVDSYSSEMLKIGYKR